MAFSDSFTPEKLNELMQNPAMIAGLQLLAQSGPQQGNPSAGVRLGAAGLGMAQQLSQNQHNKDLNTYRQAQAQAMQESQQLRAQEVQAQVQRQQQAMEQAQRQQQAFQDPALQQQLGPMARQLAALGLDPKTILSANGSDQLQQHRAAQLQQQASQFNVSQANRPDASGKPKVPSPRQVLDEPLDGSMIQRHLYNPQTNSYEKYGAPFHQYAPPKAGPLDALLNDVTPDANTDAGPAVQGLPGSNPTGSPAPALQGAELLMHGAGSNPMARKPAASAQGPATPKTESEFNALPSGALFVDPDDGKTYRKP